jgi:hypothetical protein
LIWISFDLILVHRDAFAFVSAVPEAGFFESTK